jgi:hypothetical protein
MYDTFYAFFCKYNTYMHGWNAYNIVIFNRIHQVDVLHVLLICEYRGAEEVKCIFYRKKYLFIGCEFVDKSGEVKG